MLQQAHIRKELRMILEYKLDYRSSSLVYEQIFLKALKDLSLKGTILKEHFLLKLYVQADDADQLTEFATYFSNILPHSIFLYNTEAKIVEEMPEEKYTLPEHEKMSLSFCPECLKKVMNEKDENYYNVFTECEVCGYGIDGENRNYKKEFEQAALAISQGKTIELNTFYGKYYVGMPSEVCNSVPFDIVTYDLATVETYANVETYEVTTLGAFEKPLVKLKKKIKFTMDYEGVEADLIRFKLPDDFILHLLMEELHKLGKDMIFVTKEKIETKDTLLLIDNQEELEPIEVVVSQKDVAIVSGEKGLPIFPVNAKEVNPEIGSFFSVIKEHQLKDKNIAGINLSKSYQNNLLAYGEKYGIIEYLSLNFEFFSMEDIFKEIKATDENGMKIIENYKKKFPEHFDKISKIVFKEKAFNIFKLWGVIAIVLDYVQTEDPEEAAQILEKNAMSFLGEKGPRIDYKLLNVDGKVHLDPLMTIRTAMSFRLAGVDQLMLSYGVIESFIEFIVNEVDELKASMDITAITVTGSLLSNKHLFSKISREVSMNHNIYFNNELPIDGRNMFYGGISLK